MHRLRKTTFVTGKSRAAIDRELEKECARLRREEQARAKRLREDGLFRSSVRRCEDTPSEVKKLFAELYGVTTLPPSLARKIADSIRGGGYGKSHLREALKHKLPRGMKKRIRSVL